MTAPAAMPATPFQVGLLCPACQASIQAGQSVTSCPACSTAHHEACWASAGRCGSYHCDPRTSADAAGAPAIVVTADEAANAVLPPPRIPETTAHVAAKNAPVARTRWSAAAITVLGLGFATLLCSAAAAAVAKDATPYLALASLGGIVASFAIGVAGAVIAATVRGSRTDKGVLLALLSIVCAIGASVFFVVAIVRESPVEHRGPAFELADPEPPSPESFERAPAPIANAMRANVFVAGRTGPSVLGRAWCGAGILLGQEGGFTYILTNRHVVDPGGATGGRELSVTFANAEVAPAEVDWTAPEGIDLGVLKCRALHAPRATMKLRRTPLQVSEKVFAIGNPHQLSWTYTEGAVSRVHTKRANGVEVEVVQTQTPIRPGNSGGGLYDAEGKLCGVNTWVVDPDAGGPGFSISARTIDANLPERYRKLLSAADETEGGR